MNSMAARSIDDVDDSFFSLYKVKVHVLMRDEKYMYMYMYLYVSRNCIAAAGCFCWCALIGDHVHVWQYVFYWYDLCLQCQNA